MGISIGGNVHAGKDVLVNEGGNMSVTSSSEREGLAEDITRALAELTAQLKGTPEEQLSEHFSEATRQAATEEKGGVYVTALLSVAAAIKSARQDLGGLIDRIVSGVS